jgi:2-polyprenyl-3-methyl-5-hydroxy-6-metoxy-1,4-benzoquinol methylase
MRSFILLALAFFAFSACRISSDEVKEETELNEHAFEEQINRYEDPERDHWQKPNEVIDLMAPLEGKVVADIGAGSGYFSFPLAVKAAKVIAIDIDERFLNWIDQRAENDKVSNIETRRTKDYDPLLSASEADAVLMVDVYHHIEERVAYLRKVKKGLKAEGSLWIVDFKKEELPVGPGIQMKLSPEEVISELTASGFVNISLNDSLLPYQYIIEAK